MNVIGPNGGRKLLALGAVLTLVMPVVACSSGGSVPESHEPVTASASPSPTETATSKSVPSETASSPPADVTVVVIRDLSFGSQEITVAAGDVTFVNEDDVEHTVTEGENGAAAPNGRFDVFVDIGDSVEVTFGEPGDYGITCQFHPEMHLLVHAR